MAQTEGKGGRRIEEAQGKTGQAQGDQGRTRKEIESTKEGIKIVKLQIVTNRQHILLNNIPLE